MEIDQRCRQEIEELHAFFAAWFRGELPATDEAFARFESVMHDGFVMISPDGNMLEREAVLRHVREAHGIDEAISIAIRNARVLHRLGDAALMYYEECQTKGGETTLRRSTALFIESAEAPRGVQWLHVHETWIG